MRSARVSEREGIASHVAALSDQGSLPVAQEMCLRNTAMDPSEGNTGEPASKLLKKIDRILATQEAILMQSEATDNLLKELVCYNPGRLRCVCRRRRRRSRQGR